jgi:hypothetical protein
LERYYNSSIYEFSQAAKGYWRNMDRGIRWVGREILWQMIQGNPNIEGGDKPTSRKEIFELLTDPLEKIVKKGKPTKKEMEEIKNIFNGPIK